MKSTFYIAVCFIFLIDFCYGQTSVSITGNSSGNTVVKYVNGQNQVVWEMSGGSNDDDIGARNNSINGSLGTYRTEYIFNLSSIPSNATITSAKLQYSLSDWYATNYFAVCKLSGYLGYQALWDGIGSSTLLFYDLSYNGGETSSTQDLIDAVTSNIGGTLCLGAVSQDEAHSTSYAKLNLTLNLIYTVPVQFVDITVDNNFTNSGGLNHGTMMIDGTNRTVPLAGYTIQKTVGQNLTLEAVTPQNDNQSHQMIWHTGSISQSDWTRNNFHMWYDQTKTFQVSQGDDGKRYVANLRKNYAISRNDQKEDVGTTPAGVVTHIVEQNSGNVPVLSSFPLNGKTYNFSNWVGTIGSNFTPTDNTTLTAFYKAHLYSTITTATTSNSQRKIAQGSNNKWAMVYESSNQIWLSTSTGGGRQNGISVIAFRKRHKKSNYSYGILR